MFGLGEQQVSDSERGSKGGQFSIKDPTKLVSSTNTYYSSWDSEDHYVIPFPQSAWCEWKFTYGRGHHFHLTETHEAEDNCPEGYDLITTFEGCQAAAYSFDLIMCDPGFPQSVRDYEEVSAERKEMGSDFGTRILSIQEYIL
jgi:hypothetical protein